MGTSMSTEAANINNILAHECGITVWLGFAALYPAVLTVVSLASGYKAMRSMLVFFLIEAALTASAAFYRKGYRNSGGACMTIAIVIIIIDTILRFWTDYRPLEHTPRSEYSGDGLYVA